MRRKAGVLIPIEVSILQAALGLWLRGEADFHGFMIAKELKEQADARLLTAYGTLYRALDRLAKSGMLESEWEDPQIALAEGRPRRRLYRITVAGQAALAEAPKAAAPAIKPLTGPVMP
jgi:DNA-binding PadR family transcriptional regulator